MIIERRQFLKSGGALALGTLASSAFGNVLAATKERRLKPFGIQLYSVRHLMDGNPQDTLRQIGEMGYKHIESFEGEKGMFWGMTNKEYAKFLKDNDMVAISSHCDPGNYLGPKADDAAAIGMKYLICPWIGPQKTLEEYKWKAKLFNQYGMLCKSAGIRFAYHNHDYTFNALEGKTPQDILMQETDPELVDFEMDIYWVIKAGHDPEEWFARYPKRFKLCHVKDLTTSSSGDNAGKKITTTLGDGDIDYGKILKSAKQNGLVYNFVEQEDFEGTNAYDASKANAEYMKKLVIK